MVWSTSTSNASFAKLQNTGNLQLFDETLENLQWQSFSDLRDTLVVRPREETSISSLSSIVVDKSYLLRSRPNDSSYGPPGRFHLQTDVYSVAYLRALDVVYNVEFIYLYAYINTSQGVFELSRGGGKTYRDNSSMPMSMLRLDPDGNLRIYAWNASQSTWLKVWQFLDTKCVLGSPCGAYGICKEGTNGSSLTCTCPAGYEPVDPQLVSRGCYNNLTLSGICESGRNNGSLSMVENEHSDYYYNDLSYKVVDNIEECKKLCLDDCDCIAASYRLGDKSCFLKGNQTTGLIMNGYYTDGNTLLTKLLVPPPTKRGGEVKKGAIVAAFIVVVLLVVGGAMIWWAWRAGGHVCGLMRRRHECVRVIGDGGPIKFTYPQLVEATQNFSELLGEGGYGKVYKGRVIVVMENEKKAPREKQLPVAVKVLKDTIMGGTRHGEAEKQFRAEVSTLGKIHHVNLVDLVGYCIGGGNRAPGKKRMLVYEYIENGSLARFLSREPEPLPWAVRYSIAMGTARGIAYLHHDCRPHILHCDIKPENVLLDHEFTAKVADFGLARRLEEVKSNLLMMSGALRTSGYMAPEWLKTTDITSKADVYSYGIMLLGLVRRLYERANDDESLVDWAYQFISAAKEDLDHKERRISSGGEDSLNNEEYPNGQIHEYDLDNIEIPQVEQEPVSVNLKSEKHDDEENLEKIRVLKIGLWCIQYQHELRPSMLRVVQLLEGNGDDVGIPPCPGPSEVLVGYEISSTSINMQSYMENSDVGFSAR